MDIQNHLEGLGASVIFIATVVAALGILLTKARKGLRAVRLKFAEQISDVVFSHPSFIHIDKKVDKFQDELTLNGGESIKDKVNATHRTVKELSLRLGNVEQQLENTAVDSVDKAKEGGRRKGDNHPPTHIS